MSRSRQGYGNFVRTPILYPDFMRGEFEDLFMYRSSNQYNKVVAPFDYPGFYLRMDEPLIASDDVVDVDPFKYVAPIAQFVKVFFYVVVQRDDWIKRHSVMIHLNDAAQGAPTFSDGQIPGKSPDILEFQTSADIWMREGDTIKGRLKMYNENGDISKLPTVLFAEIYGVRFRKLKKQASMFDVQI